MSSEMYVATTAIIYAVGFGVGIFGAVLGSTLFVLVPLLSTCGMTTHTAVGTAVAVPLTLSTADGAALGARLAINRENRTLRIVFRVLIGLLAIRYLF